MVDVLALQGQTEISLWWRKKRENKKEKKKKKRKNINGGVIYVADSNHTKKDRLPIIPYMDTYMRLEWSEKHDAMHQHTESPLKAWQLSADPDTSLPFLSIQPIPARTAKKITFTVDMFIYITHKIS